MTAISNSEHRSVLLDEALQALALRPDSILLDATAGQGGHSFAALSQWPGLHVVALDADPRAVEATRARLEPFGGRARVVEANFGDLTSTLDAQNMQSVDAALFDLGWNSTQLQSGRGFSFRADEPLNMSYGGRPASGFTAAEILNEWDEATLADLLFGYGEERYARRIAKAIAARRQAQPLATARELSEIVEAAVPAAYRRGRIHPATKTFQALRMAVNDELGVLERGLVAAWERLACGGRLAVITFHSVEDRAVKRLFSSFAKGGGPTPNQIGRLITKKPQSPSRQELLTNPRARSAKLRAIEKICTQ